MRLIHEPRELATLIEAVAPPDQLFPDFDPHEWIRNPDHLAFAIEHDLVMFEHLGANRWLGHIWFVSRGKRALARAAKFLDLMTTRFSAVAILGEIPSHRKDVLAFMARLGFERIGKGRHPSGMSLIVVKRGT